MEDDKLASFAAITSTDPLQAAQYLQLTEGNLEQAIQLFFEGGPLDVGAASATEATVGSSTNATSANFVDDDGVVHIDSDDDDDEFHDAPHTSSARTRPIPGTFASRPPNPNIEDDEAMARRLQEEMYGSGGSGIQRMGEDDVRAPMARTTETLVGPDADWGTNEADMRAAVTEQLRARQRVRAARPGIFNQRDTASVWEDADDSDSRRRNLARATGGASEVSAKSNMLAEMYRPPFELISPLSWDHARDEGKDMEKWLLVNIQDQAIFDCQVLNRDLWKNGEIKDTVKENFIFLQYNKDDPRGAPYIQYYFTAADNQDSYPHIAIVDPRTGEQVKTWSGTPVPKPLDFLMQLHEFLDRYSLKANSRNPVAKRKPEPKKEKDVARMTEDEMLEMALQNSLANNNTSTSSPREEDPDALTRDDPSPPQFSDDKGKGRAVDTDGMDLDNQTLSSAPAPQTASPFSLISSTSPHVEPPNDPATTTRMQFRYSGGRLIRRFALTDPVRRIYEWLKAEPLAEMEGRAFELIFMGRNLMGCLEEEIGEAGLRNGTVMVEFVDE